VAITAQQVITRVRSQIIDPNGVRWTDEELLRWLSDGLRTVLSAKPSALSTIAVVSLVAGTRQQLPADGYMLLGIVRNMGSNGATPGRAVRVVSREALDAYKPDWHAATSAAVVQNFIFDPETFNSFYVYPPNDGTGKVEAVYARSVTELVALTSTLPILDNYLTALTDYVLFRSHQKDGDYAGGQGVAQTYLNAFAQFVGVAGAAETASNVNRGLRPGDKDAAA